MILVAPDRRDLPPGHAKVRFEAVKLNPDGFAPLGLAGAWQLTSDDRRFGGLSALALGDGRLLALTDSGVVIRFDIPGGSAISTASFTSLPAGPCDPHYKSCRDSEALVRDPRGRGWWVAFENRNELWLYDGAFTRPLQRIRFGHWRWRRNRGVEGLAGDGADLLAFPEDGNAVLRVDGSRAAPVRLDAARLSDAARLPDGRLLVIERAPTLLGFRNRLALVERAGGSYRARPLAGLAVGALDNMEGIAAQRLASGGTRLWIVSDDNFQRPLRTLLIALDLPRPRQPG